MLKVLYERAFPCSSVRCAAGPNSVGTKLEYGGGEVEVQALTPDFFDGADIALFAMKDALSLEWAPIAAKRCGVVIDNSGAFRLDPGVPLVVPEINANRIAEADRHIIANPNCSTIQMVVALKPLQDRYGIRRVVVSTYQSVSGAGYKGLRQLEMERAGIPEPYPAFPHPVLNSPLPHIARFEDDGYTREERKMIAETRKILEDAAIAVAPTCVRVPVPNCHSESVNVELLHPYELAEARSLIAAASGIVVIDDPAADRYPLAADAAGRDEVFVGRLRRDDTVPNGLAMWIVSDNLRKGAATNAVQIAELWIKNSWS
jgi:aspartate-semialdehyde dehydrogenase